MILAPGISADQLNDDRLGRALDKLYDTGLTTIFSHISRRTFEVLDYTPDEGHLDSTTMSVYGRYNSDQEEISELHEINHLEEHEQLLLDYKAQHSVERGFRFIKDPNVVASSFYVQKPSKVAALMFIMTCCLLIYSALQFRIRQALETEDKSVPNQKGKPTQRPTTRWVFQLFVGIHELYLPNNQRMILNLKQEHRNIIDLLDYWGFYS